MFPSPRGEGPAETPPRAGPCCSGLAGQLADALAKVEGELEHGGGQALVDEVPRQATLGGEQSGTEL